MWRSLAQTCNLTSGWWSVTRGGAQRPQWQRLEPFVSYQCPKPETGTSLLEKRRDRHHFECLKTAIFPRRKPSHSGITSVAMETTGHVRWQRIPILRTHMSTHYYDLPVMVIQALLRFVSYVAGSSEMRGNGSITYILQSR